MALAQNIGNHRNIHPHNSHCRPYLGINVGFKPTLCVLDGKEPCWYFSNLPMIPYFHWKIKTLLNSPRLKISFKHWQEVNTTDAFLTSVQICLLHINDLWKLFIQIPVEIIYFRIRAASSTLRPVWAACFAEEEAKTDQTFPSAVWSLCFLVELQHVTVFFFAA